MAKPKPSLIEDWHSDVWPDPNDLTSYLRPRYIVGKVNGVGTITGNITHRVNNKIYDSNGKCFELSETPLHANSNRTDLLLSIPELKHK